jgi:hypothetical protein
MIKRFFNWIFGKKQTKPIREGYHEWSIPNFQGRISATADSYMTDDNPNRGAGLIFPNYTTEYRYKITYDLPAMLAAAIEMEDYELAADLKKQIEQQTLNP